MIWSLPLGNETGVRLDIRISRHPLRFQTFASIDFQVRRHMYKKESGTIYDEDHEHARAYT